MDNGSFVKKKIIWGWILGLIFVLAVGLRILAFSYRDSYEDDECRLLSAYLDKSWIQMFFNIGDAQSAPPLFIIFERFWGCVWGFGEKSLKCVPLIASIASILLFYKISTEIFLKKYSILIANFLFAINIKLVNFSSIIKQYSTDVFIGLLCTIILSKIDITKLSIKKMIMLSLFLIILPLISLPSLFFIGAFLLVNLINNFKNKHFYYRLAGIILPFLTVLICYYLFNLAPSKISLDSAFPDYWDVGLVGLSFTNFVKMQVISFNYFFYPNICSIFTFILLYFGIYYTYKKGNNTARFLLFVIGFGILASILKLYPFVGRVALYIIPFLIIFCTKPLEQFTFKNWKFYIFMICFVITFGKYDISFAKELISESAYINYSPKVLMETLIQQFNPKTDVVLCNSASDSSYLFYSSFYKFNTSQVYELPLYGKMEDSEIKSVLNELPSNKNYWFYLIKDFSFNKDFPAILEWTESQKVLYRQKARDSYLIQVKKL